MARPLPVKQFLKLAASVAVLLATSPTASADGVNIANQPLTVAEPVPPNIFYILDDSGSMNRDDMPDSISCSDRSGGSDNVIQPNGRLRNGVSNRCQSSDFNKLYYNPNFTYTPPVDFSGSALASSSANTFTNAYVDGYLSSNNTYTDLSAWVDETWSNSISKYRDGWVCASRSRNTPYTYSDCNTATSRSPIEGYQRLTQAEAFSHYRLISGRSAGSTNDTDYQKVMAQPAEYQNVANWYAYYRTRLFTARAGTSLAFSNLPSKYRFGYGSINTSGTKVRGVTPFSSAKSQFYEWLFKKASSGGTPLRRALDEIGQYYSQAEPWRLDPADSKSSLLSCRSSFSILMTDGYWSGGTDNEAATMAAKANVDGSKGSLITGPNNQSYTYAPTGTFSDGYSNTLADVAMHYWKNDLRPKTTNDPGTNNVPVSDADPAFWQHMVTIGIGLGVEGTIQKQDAFNALKQGTGITWPDPLKPDSADNSSNPSKIDDLLHAAINSRGYFFSAKNPQEFTEGLKQSLANIQSRLGSGNSLAVDSATLAKGATIYKSSFKSVLWSGELSAYALDANGIPAATPKWLASSKLPSFDLRTIYTRVDGAAKAFTWANLNATQKTALGSETILNYLRGDQSQEVANNGRLRTRNSPLGDIVNSSPVYVAAPDPYLFRNRSWPEAGTHDDFAATQSSRGGMVYVGANDGMLHGFNAATGVETFAYLPESLVNPNPTVDKTLASLADPEYEHRYFVDGELTVADAYVGGAWKSILVGSLGRGGKTLFGIDVTQPASINETKMLWEVSPSSLGQVVGKPLIGRLPSGTWVAVVGNGYNSSNHQAALLVVNLANGSVTPIGTGVGSALDPNGLAGPYLWDANGDGNFETAYAGDLKGNVWRFDLERNTATKLFQAVDGSSQPQPITSSVRVSKDPETLKTWVFFGTGKYLGSADPGNWQIQTWYGLIDDQSAISGRSALVPRPILADTTVGSITARTISEAVEGDLVGKRGWYIDLIVKNEALGERMILPNQIVGASSLVGVSLVPIGDTCNPGGTGYIMVINPFTGGRLGYGFFDYSGDGVINAGDLVGGVTGSGISFNSIPSNPVFKGTKMIVQTDQGQVHAMTVAPPYPPGETQRVMWRELSDD